MSASELAPAPAPAIAPAIAPAPGSGRPGGERLFTPKLWLFFAVVTLIWGSTWLVITFQLGEVPASWSVTWRFLLAGLALAGWCLATGKRLHLSGRGHAFAAVLGLMQFVLNFNFVYRAEEHVTSGVVALSYALLLIPNALFSFVFLGVRVSARFALGAAIGIIGVALICWADIEGPGVDSGEMLVGMSFAFAGLLAASIANVMQATGFGRSQPLEAMLVWGMGYAVLINAAVAWVLSGPPQFSTSLLYISALGYLGLAASALAFVLYYQLIREVGAGRAAYSGVLVPLVALGHSTLFEGFQWTAAAAAGSALALIGLVLAIRSR